MKKCSVLLLFALLACQQAADKPVARPDVDATPQPTRVYPLIAGDGIGSARAGMTLAEFRAALPPGTNIGELDQRFMVDLTALPVIMETDTLYYLLFSQVDALSDTQRLQLVATLNPQVRTAEGVGPGTSIEEAARKYGEPTLSYSTNDESREYAKFPRYTARNVLFRVGPGEGNAFFAGKYTTEGEYNETTSFDPAAAIKMILVDLSRR